MKKALLIFILLWSLNLVAQHDRREHLKSLKIAFITEQIDLSEKEAQQFWPIYNAHENELNEIRFQDIRAIRMQIRNQIDSMSEEKAKDLLNKLNAAESRMHALEADFTKKLEGVISSKKIILLRIAEEDFKRKMLEELKNRRKERG